MTPFQVGLVIRGTMVEIGVLDIGGQGIVLQVDGELVKLNGLTREQCKALVGCMEQVVEITIRGAAHE